MTRLLLLLLLLPTPALASPITYDVANRLGDCPDVHASCNNSWSGETLAGFVTIDGAALLAYDLEIRPAFGFLLDLAGTSGAFDGETLIVQAYDPLAVDFARVTLTLRDGTVVGGEVYRAYEGLQLQNPVLTHAPEPATLVLLGVGLLAVRRRVR